MTKIVNGQVIVTRAVSPEAYEHVARAYLYEEEERWQEAAAELQRALPFDAEAAEVRAELGGAVRPPRPTATTPPRRSSTRCPSSRRSRAIWRGAPGRGALRRSLTNLPPIPRRRWTQAAGLALADEDAEQIETTHLELADVQMGTWTSTALESCGGWSTRRRRPQRGRLQLAALAWTRDALDEARRR